MITDIVTNEIFISTLAAVVLAQIIKAIIDFRVARHFHWQSLLRGAGMPSSHTATVTALSLSVFLAEGITTLSIVTFFLSAIVIRDVIGDKVFAVHQESMINRIIQQIAQHEKVQWQHLIGHTFTEVLMGLVLGVLVTLSVFFII